MHFEDDPENPEELTGWILGSIFGFAGVATLVGIPAWFCIRTGELNVEIPVSFLPIAAFCFHLSRMFLVPQISVDLERSPRRAHVVRMNLLTRRRRKRSYSIPDDACVILEESDCVYSVKIRKAPFRSIYLTQPRHGDEAGPLAVNVARFLGIEVEDRRNGVRWVP